MEAASQGFDRVLAEASFTLEAGSEVEMFTTIDNLATNAINLTGNALAQYLYGNAGSNRLDGGGGGDVMVGFQGDDFYVVRHVSDRAVEAAGQGFDRVLAGASFRLEAGSHVEMFTTIDNLATTAINLTGNALAQYLYGNAGANRLDGGGGGDVMVGFEGDDIYYTRHASDRALESAGQGFDRVLAGASFALEAGSEVEFFTTIDNLGTAAIDLTGNALSQFLYGNAGANRLDGKGGADVMTGFGGADNFAFTSRRAAPISIGSPTSTPPTTRSCSTMRCSPAWPWARSIPTRSSSAARRPTPTTASSTIRPPADCSSTPTAADRAARSNSRRSTPIRSSPPATLR